MKFMFPYHYNDCSDDKRKVFFQLGGIEYAIPIIKGLDFVDQVEIIDEGIILSICIQQIPEIARVLVQKNIAIYSIIIEKDS